jgi:hypothetical protein
LNIGQSPAFCEYPAIGSINSHKSAKGAVPRRQETEGAHIPAAARTRPVLRVVLRSGGEQTIRLDCMKLLFITDKEFVHGAANIEPDTPVCDGSRSDAGASAGAGGIAGEDQKSRRRNGRI